MLTRKAIAVVVLLASPALGGQKFYAVGAATCGQWHEAAQANGNQRAMYASWLFGYVTGVNSTAPGYGVLLSGEQIKAYVDHYCDNNPLHSLTGAAAALIDEAGGPKAEHKWNK